MTLHHHPVQLLGELQNEDADEVSQGQVFAGENYKRRYEVEGVRWFRMQAIGSQDFQI